MAIVPLPLPPAAEAQALLHHLLEHGDVVGRDTAGRTIIQLAVDDWTLEKLLTFDTDATELEDGATTSPMPTTRRMVRRLWSSSCGRRWSREGRPLHQAASAEPP